MVACPNWGLVNEWDGFDFSFLLNEEEMGEYSALIASTGNQLVRKLALDHLVSAH